MEKTIYSFGLSECIQTTQGFVSPRTGIINFGFVVEDTRKLVVKVNNKPTNDFNLITRSAIRINTQVAVEDLPMKVEIIY